eukprot:CAMPEP_0178964726 /NCGR_PEP_ID=MMETSP0789-20121207/15848_1 /TAXON_ID=3005 /ORGANISM="Rhizosolenia setigera, Strain CCMP 1694" /LENGTH=63 /DNA_ID=CAMNT_0020649555 /DNA_START=218 /DNA_END=409 /DNA_ORIENTATION=+
MGIKDNSLNEPMAAPDPYNYDETRSKNLILHHPSMSNFFGDIIKAHLQFKKFYLRHNNHTDES